MKPSPAPPWTLAVSGDDYGNKEFGGRDLFEALIALRRDIEAQGGRLLCAGARRDVYSSGMARSMGNARKAYVMKLGEPATVMVDIFDHADPNLVSTIDEQRNFRDQWVASLKERFGA